MALFGTKEWYFYTPRDRKYPNGSRPNRAAGNGYWKATGADKPIRPRSSPKKTVGIKKSLVFYAGKGPKGIKTNWIMHEYRLTTQNLRNATNCKLDDWVLCRLYNKKNNPNEKIIPEYHHHRLHHQLLSEESQRDSSNNSSFNSFEESDGDFGNFDDQGQVNNDQDIMFLGNFEPQTLTKVNATSNHNKSHTMEMKYFMQEDDEWLANLSLEDLQHSLKAMSDDFF